MSITVGDARLVGPAPSWRAAFVDMAEEWRAQGAGGRYDLALNHFEGYLDQLRRDEHGRQLPPGYVPGIERWVVDGDRVVGGVRLRFWLTPALEIEGGHVGYDTRPSARGRGYGTAALALILPEARARGIARLRITADTDNVASCRIIEKNGGVLSGEAVSGRTGKEIRQYWIG